MNERYKYEARGYITNVNYSSKKFVFLLFINHRLVESQSEFLVSLAHYKITQVLCRFEKVHRPSVHHVPTEKYAPLRLLESDT